MVRSITGSDKPIIIKPESAIESFANMVRAVKSLKSNYDLDAKEIADFINSDSDEDSDQASEPLENRNISQVQVSVPKPVEIQTMPLSSNHEIIINPASSIKAVSELIKAVKVRKDYNDEEEINSFINSDSDNEEDFKAQSVEQKSATNNSPIDTSGSDSESESDYFENSSSSSDTELPQASSEATSVVQTKNDQVLATKSHLEIIPNKFYSSCVSATQLFLNILVKLYNNKLRN